MRALLLSCLLASRLCGAARAYAPEIPSAGLLVQAYQSVFTPKGGSTVATVSPPVTYVEDRLRVLVGIDPDDPLDLSRVRAMDQARLLQLLFRAVAGDFTAGPNALRPDVCRLVSDPVTGFVDVTRSGEEDEPVLAVIAIILLCVTGVMMYRHPPPAR